MSGRNAPSARCSSSTAGFTLIELMITVAIVAVLAILAGVGYARWLRTSKTGEATAMLAALKGGEETYRAETYQYLDVSNCGTSCAALPTSSTALYYPSSVPNDQRTPWNPLACIGTPICANFVKLNISADNTSAGVYYRYAAAAGPATGAAFTFDGRAYPAANDPWFVAKAWGDLNADGVYAQYWTSSMDSTVWSTNPDE